MTKHRTEHFQNAGDQQVRPGHPIKTTEKYCMWAQDEIKPRKQNLKRPSETEFREARLT
jgi:hypothetical protein